MASRSDIERLRKANLSIETLALRALNDFWGSLDLTKPEAARNELLRFIPTLTDEYGEIAAVVAADWYDDIRDAAPVRSVFTAMMADPFPAEYVQQRVRFGAKHLFTDAPDAMLPFLEGITSEYALQPGRETVAESTKADPETSGWHRETRHGACGFCRLLAGRGGVYRKESTASFAAHHKCHCVAVPSWDADAPEVPVSAYVASERMSGLRRRAANGDADAQSQLDDHRARVREYVARMDGN